jgi:hypothetical protein
MNTATPVDNHMEYARDPRACCLLVTHSAVIGVNP